MFQLSEKDFDIFKSECLKWIDLFGITEWEISFSFEYLENARAECRINWLGKTCVICLTNFSPKYDKFDIKKSAFHEVCELLLTEMEYISLDEEIPYDERKGLTESARHSVIRRMENSIFKRL